MLQKDTETRVKLLLMERMRGDDERRGEEEEGEEEEAAWGDGSCCRVPVTSCLSEVAHSTMTRMTSRGLNCQFQFLCDGLEEDPNETMQGM